MSGIAISPLSGRAELLVRPAQDPAGWDANSAAIWARVTPAIETRFVRLFSPATILTADKDTFKRSASSRRSASFARSSTGGAVSRTFSAPWIFAFDRVAARPRRHRTANMICASALL